MTNARNINLTVFHDAALPPDDFVANCIIPFEDLMQSESSVPDLWVSNSVYIDCNEFDFPDWFTFYNITNNIFEHLSI